MDGDHDIGGMHGFGPIPVEENEPIFHGEWEKRAFGIEFFTNARIGVNGDQFRYANERLPADLYLSVPYYEKWMLALQTLLEETGTLTQAEIEGRMAEIQSGEQGVG